MGWKDWLEHYERFADINGWLPTDYDAAKKFALKLEGEALQFFNMLPPQVKASYPAAIQAFNEHFGAVKTLNHTLLQQTPDESARSFTTRFKAAVRAAYGEDMLTNPKSFPWLFDTYCKAVLDKSAVMFVRMQKPRTRNEAYIALDSYIQDAQEYGMSTPYIPCNTLTKSDTPAALEISDSQPQQGDKTRKLPCRTFLGIPAPYRGYRGICWHCGEPNHMIRECEKAQVHFKLLKEKKQQQQAGQQTNLADQSTPVTQNFQ